MNLALWFIEFLFWGIVVIFALKAAFVALDMILED